MAEPSSSETEQHDKRDLCAQFLAASAAQSSANLANAQSIIGGVGLAAVFFTLLLNAVATSAATSQAATARRVYEELERPYLVATVVQNHPAVTKAVLTNDPGIFIPFDTATNAHFHFANVGRTPAMLVKRARHRIARWATSGPPEPLIPEISPYEELDPHGALVTTSEPSQEFSTKGEFRLADPALRAGPNDQVVWYFIGYAIYRDLTGSHLYVAGFCHWYSVKGGQWFLYQTNKAPDQYNYDRLFRAPNHERHPDVLTT